MSIDSLVGVVAEVNDCDTNWYKDIDVAEEFGSGECACEWKVGEGGARSLYFVCSDGVDMHMLAAFPSPCIHSSNYTAICCSDRIQFRVHAHCRHHQLTSPVLLSCTAPTSWIVSTICILLSPPFFPILRCISYLASVWQDFCRVFHQAQVFAT